MNFDLNCLSKGQRNILGAVSDNPGYIRNYYKEQYAANTEELIMQINFTTINRPTDKLQLTGFRFQ